MLALTLLLVPPAQEAPPPPPGPPIIPTYLHFSKELGLSDEQKTSLRTIHEAHQDSLRSLHDAFHEAQKAMMDVVQGDRSGDLKALNDSFAARHLALMSEMASIQSESFAVLTPAQQVKAKEIHARRPEGSPDQGMRPQGQGPGRRTPKGDADRSGPPEREN